MLTIVESHDLFFLSTPPPPTSRDMNVDRSSCNETWKHFSYAQNLALLKQKKHDWRFETCCTSFTNLMRVLSILLCFARRCVFPFPFSLFRYYLIYLYIYISFWCEDLGLPPRHTDLGLRRVGIPKAFRCRPYILNLLNGGDIKYLRWNQFMCTGATWHTVRWHGMSWNGGNTYDCEINMDSPSQRNSNSLSLC